MKKIIESIEDLETNTTNDEQISADIVEDAEVTTDSDDSESSELVVNEEEGEDEIEVESTDVEDIQPKPKDIEEVSELVFKKHVRIYTRPHLTAPYRVVTSNLKIIDQVNDFTKVLYVKPGFGPVLGFVRSCDL